jgi:GYF domain 2
MPYQVSRNGQTYGPYTLEDLQRYIASGNIALTDLAKSEDMPDWLPVAQIVNIPSAPTFATQPYAPPADYQAPDIPYPDPPNLNWGIVLLIDFFTCGIFQVIWNIVIAAWAKKVEPSSKALMFFIIATIAVFANAGTSVGNVMAVMHHTAVRPNYIGAFIGLASWVLRLIARFSLRETLERHFNGPEPLGLRLNPVLTFFFGGIYHQYKLNQMNELKQAMRYRGIIR